MGFFSKMKGFFGYGILDIDVQCPTTIDRHQPLVAGKLVINVKQADFVEKVQMKVAEVWQKKDINNNPVHEEFQLGNLEFTIGQQVNEGDVLHYDFEIPLRLLKSMGDHLRDQGGVLGGIGKMSSLLKSEKSNFWFTTTVHVKSASFEPNKTVELYLS